MGLRLDPQDDEWPSPDAFKFAEAPEQAAVPRRRSGAAARGNGRPLPGMQADHWRMACLTCELVLDDLESRDHAIAEGYAHKDEKHAMDDEWSFRVQGIRKPRR